MSRYVHIVMGDTGEYGDYGDWQVVAYLDGRKAYAHAKRANRWAKDNNLHRDNMQKNKYYLDALWKNPHNKLMRLDYTGVSYRVQKVCRGITS